MTVKNVSTYPIVPCGWEKVKNHQCTYAKLNSYNTNAHIRTCMRMCAYVSVWEWEFECAWVCVCVCVYTHIDSMQMHIASLLKNWFYYISVLLLYSSPYIYTSLLLTRRIIHNTFSSSSDVSFFFLQTFIFQLYGSYWQSYSIYQETTNICQFSKCENPSVTYRITKR